MPLLIFGNSMSCGRVVWSMFQHEGIWNVDIIQDGSVQLVKLLPGQELTLSLTDKNLTVYIGFTEEPV